MNTSIVTRSLGASLASAIVIAAAACDDGGRSSSGSGSSGDGGSGPTGSSSSSAASSSGAGGSSGAASLIDNMEDGDGSIAADAGRKGAWYTYNDETATGMQTPVVKSPFT